MIIDEMKPFWFVMLEGSGSPTVRHLTQDSAEAEAERLSREFRGRSALVLMCIGAVKATDVQWRRVRPADIPF